MSGAAVVLKIASGSEYPPQLIDLFENVAAVGCVSPTGPGLDPAAVWESTLGCHWGSTPQPAEVDNWAAR